MKKKKIKNIATYYKTEGTPIFRDTTALPFLTGGPLVDKTNHGKLLPSLYASSPGNYYVEGGVIDSPPNCGPGYYWNGSECVKAKVITDPDEYAFRKAAYEDSLYLYNHYKDKEPKKPGKIRDVKGGWHSPNKTYIKTFNLSNPSEKKYYPSYGSSSSAWNKYINKQYDKAIETGNFDTFDKIRSPENKPIRVKNYYGVYPTKERDTGKTSVRLTTTPYFKKPKQPVVFLDKNALKKSIPPKPVKKPIPNKAVNPVIKNQPIPISQPIAQTNLPIQDQIVQDQIVRDQIKLDRLPIRPIVLSNSIGQLQGTPVENLPPSYSIPFTGMKWHDDYKTRINWGHKGVEYHLPRFRKPGHGGDLIKKGKSRYIHLPTLEKYNEAYLAPRDPYTVQDKLIRKFSGYNPEEMEGYQGGDAYYPGEIERAEEEGRRIQFQGYRNKADIARQKEYNRAYDEYEAKKGYEDMILQMYQKGVNPFAYKTGGMLKRADGSYSKRGLWDNIRANAGSGKKPTKEMLAQERKISKQYDNGGTLTKLTPAEEKQFQSFYKTLPENLQTDDSTYDIRGYWDSEGRPESFNYDQPTEDDGYYHAYSINSNTGEYLKSPAHPTFQHAVDEDRKIGYRPITNVYGRNIAVENSSIANPEEQSFLRNMQGPITYRTGGQFPRPYSLPEDSFKQGGNNLHNSIYASSPAQYPAIYKNGGGMSSRFYASNVPDNNISNKDLTYPENSYVYRLGGGLIKKFK